MFEGISGTCLGAGDHDLDQLKIMVVSTAKTGNTWIKHLLSVIYDLPLVDFGDDFHREELEHLGPRWIGHQHYYPLAPLLEWAQDHQVVLVTTVRHPCDVLISLYHYTANYSHDPRADKSLLSIAGQDQGQFGLALADFIRSRFFLYLNNSISWIRSGRSHIVRYEDLWRDPVTTLTGLTTQIHPVRPERIERAIERCSIDMMRQRFKSEARFFRQGQVGNWRHVLPQEIVSLFRTVPLYLKQFAALGYTLDPSDPLIDAPALPRTLDNPFRDVTHFDNGIEIQPIMIDHYFSLPGEVTRGWEKIESTRPANTFFAWLMAPAVTAQQPAACAPLVTNLMAHIHRSRPDLQARFPEPFDRQRIHYVRWFIERAEKEFGIPRAFVDPVEASFLDWARLPCPEDPHRDEPLPLVTNLVSYIYNSRQDLMSKYLDLFGQDRIAFLLWFLKNAPKEYTLSPQAIEPVSTSFLAWSTLPSLHDPQLEVAVPIVTNLGAALHGLRPDLQAAHPDLYGRNRVDFSAWFTEIAPADYDLEPAYILPVLDSWATPSGFGAYPDALHDNGLVPTASGDNIP